MVIESSPIALCPAPHRLGQLASAPRYAIRKLFGLGGEVYICDGRAYGRVSQADGTYRFGWFDGERLLVTAVEIGGSGTVSLTSARDAALVVSKERHLLRVPLDGAEPRVLCDLGPATDDTYLPDITGVVELSEGWYAALDRGALGAELTLLHPEDGQPFDQPERLVERSWYGLPGEHATRGRDGCIPFDGIRSVLDGRVILVPSFVDDSPNPGMLVIGHRDGTLRTIAAFRGGDVQYIAIPLSQAANGGFDCYAWLSQPYYDPNAAGLMEITGLEAAVNTAFADESPSRDLPAAPGGRPQRQPCPSFHPVAPLEVPPAPVPTGEQLGVSHDPHLARLLSQIRKAPRHPAPNQNVLDLIEPGMGEDLVALMRACAHHDARGLVAGVGDPPASGSGEDATESVPAPPDLLDFRLVGGFVVVTRQGVWADRLDIDPTPVGELVASVLPEEARGGVFLGFNGAGDAYIALFDGWGATGVLLVSYSRRAIIRRWCDIDDLLRDISLSHEIQHDANAMNS